MPGRIFSPLIFSNLFIALCASALTAEVFVIFKINFQDFWFLVVVGCSTLLVYNLHYLAKSGSGKADIRLDWVKRNKGFVYLTSFAAFIILLWQIVVHYRIFFFAKNTLSTIKILLFVGVPLIAILYSHKIIPGVKSSAREWPWLKPTYLAFVWVIATGLVPIYLVSQETIITEWRSVFSYFLFQFSFIMGLCILFNIKDAEVDKADGLKTLVVQLGTGSMLSYGKWAVLFTNLISAVLFLFVYPYSSFPLCGILLLIVFMKWRLFYRFASHKNIAAFALQYDGLMIIKAALLIFAKQTNII